MSKSIGISFPNQLIEQIDEKRGDIARSRFVWKIIEKEFRKKGESK